MMKFLEIKANEQIALNSQVDSKKQDQNPVPVHVFDQESIDAVNAAIAAQRPLLIRGEPGVGKSQLAHAVAKVLKRVFVKYVVDSHCEPRDLLWHFDAVQRLADAQLGSALGESNDEIKSKLNIKNYLHPGPLWWAFDWESANTQATQLKLPKPDHEGDTSNGCVVLIDEIDKAEMDVPNGLLEALGDKCFTPIGWKKSISALGAFPLVIITTNEERALPKAFLRRCLVLHLDLFKEKDVARILIERGKAHFLGLKKEGEEENNEQDDCVFTKAANLLLEDRAKAIEKQQRPLPGQAEYLDLLRAVYNLSRNGKGTPQELIDKVACYVMNKQAGVVE